MNSFTIPGRCQGPWFGGAANAKSRELAFDQPIRVRDESISWYARADLAPDDLIAGLDAVPVLERLTVNGSGVAHDAVVQAIVRHPRLSSVTIERAALTEAHASQLATATRLRELSLHESPVSDAVFEPLTALALTTLQLKQPGEGFTDASLARIGSMSSLVSLHVSQAPALEGTTLSALQSARSLDTLALSWHGALDAKKHLAALTAHRSLTQLWLEHIASVGDEACAVAASIAALTSLQLRGCRRVTDAGLALLHAHASLKYIALPTSKYAKKVSSAGVDALVAARPGCTVFRG